MSYQFMLPGRTLVGQNALEGCGDILTGFGRRALVVTGKIVVTTDAMKKLAELLNARKIGYSVFDGITGEPTDRMIEEGVRRYREDGCDFLIGIGGGSPLDSAKAIAAMTVLKGKISDFMGQEIRGDFPPVVLIPTTAGTGSEATKFTIITDTEKDVKMLLKGDALLPQLAVLDPDFTLSAPPGVTAATGMDALTHAVESYTSRKATPLTDLYALDAVRRIFAFLPEAYRDGGNLKAREEMALAAYEAGVCINNASVTLVHGMSRPIGALFHVAHGLSNAMLIHTCLSFAMDGCPRRFAELARTIGAAPPSCDDRAAAESFLTALGELCRVLEIPTLADYGISKEEFFRAAPKMAKDAMASGSPSNTVKFVSEEDLLFLYSRLW